MRPLNEAISAHAPSIEAAPSESSALTGLRRAFDIPRLFRSRFRRDLGLTVFTQIGLLGIGALTGLLSARLLGPQGRGELAAVTLWPMALISLTHLGTNSALVFHAGRRRYGFSHVLTAATVLGVLQAIFVILLGLAALPLALRSYPPGVERLAIIFLCFAPVVILGGQPASILQGKLDLSGYNLVRTIAPAAYAMGLLALLFLRRPHLGDVVACQLVAFVLATIWGYGLVGSREGFRLAWHGEACKSLLSFGWRTQLSNVAVFFNQRLDQLLLSVFVPPQQLGLYVVSVTVTSVLNIVPQAAGIVTYATGSNLSSNEAGRVIARSLQISLVWLGLGCLLFFVIAPWLIPFAFGRDFAGSVLACRILLPGSVALGLSQVLYDGARALNQPALPFHAEGCSLIVTLGCLYLLVPRFRFVGAAVASTLAYCTSLAITLVLFGRRTGLGWRELTGLATGHAPQNTF